MLTLTYQFENEAALLAHLTHNKKTPVTEQKAEKASTPLVKQPARAAAEAAQAVVSQTAPANGAAAPAETQSAKVLTLDDVRAEFRAYVDRPGLSATTAHANILVPHGLNSLKEAKPEQYLALYNAFRSAA